MLRRLVMIGVNVVGVVGVVVVRPHASVVRWVVRPRRVGRVRVRVRVAHRVSAFVESVEAPVAAHVGDDVVHAQVVPVDVERPLLRELLACLGLVDLPLQIRRVRAFLLIRGDAPLRVARVVNVAQAVEPLRPRPLFVVLVEHHAGRIARLAAAVRESRVTVIVNHRAASAFLFQRGFPVSFLARLLLVVLRLTLASEHFPARFAALARGAPVVLALGRVLRGVRGRRAPAPGRTHAAGGTAGRAVEPAGRPARGEESLALLQVHRACAFRDRGTSSRTSSSRGTERRGTARARSVAGAWVTPWSGGGDVRVSSALPEARLEVPRRFGDRSRTELRSEKKVNGTMLCAAFSDRSRYHLIDKAVSKSQKRLFQQTAKKRTACWCDLEVGTRRAFLGTDVHARARHLRVEGWKRPRRATRARPPRRRGKTTPRASPGRCTTPRPTRTRRETMRMKSPCVIFTSPLAAP